MNDVQVWDGQGVQPPSEPEQPKRDPLLFEKRLIMSLELMADDMRELFNACRDPNGGSINSFAALDNLMNRLKSLSSSHAYMYEDLIRNLKRDIGLNEYEKIKLPNSTY